MKLYIATLLYLKILMMKGEEPNVLEDFSKDLHKIYQRYFPGSSMFSKISLPEYIKPIDIIKEKPMLFKYDFIIVGSGSSGSVIANRLSEIPDWNILLLEAGKTENAFSRVPLAAPTLAFTHYNWNHTAEYQPNVSVGCQEQKMLWPRGRALGGTSVINYMIYTRGNRLDYNRWADLGNPGWDYESVLPYFLKSEAANLKTGDKELHGTRGYWSVENVYQSDLAKSFVRAGVELGFPEIDYNANLKSFGFSRIQGNVRRGRRHTVANAYLNPIKHRLNLNVLTEAFVTRILIDPQTKEAYGVEFERHNKKIKVFSKKEVILSAGTFHSPQLLMLAGIGPAEHLQELRIPVLKDLPVGKNLQDHITYPGLSFLINQEVALSFNYLLNYTSVYNFLIHGVGPFTSLGGVEAIGYIKTNISKENDDIPDIEIFFLDGSLSTDYGLFSRKWMNIRDDIYDAVWAPCHNFPTWSAFPMLLHPKSRGFLKLRSQNPHDYPLLYGNFFTDPENEDIDTLVAGIRFIQKLAKTKAFQKFGSKQTANAIPGCEHFIYDSDDYWRCALRSIAVTLHHQIGTAKMGPPNDPTSVVNHELKVHGIEKLRVADSSVVPLAVGAHTSAVAVMIGEKAADIIKTNWKKIPIDNNEPTTPSTP